MDGRHKNEIVEGDKVLRGTGQQTNDPRYGDGAQSNMAQFVHCPVLRLRNSNSSTLPCHSALERAIFRYNEGFRY